MFYENELYFLCDTLKKCHVSTAIVTPNDNLGSIIPAGLDSIFTNIYSVDTPLHKIIGNSEPRTMYKATDVLELSYIYFILPDTQKTSFLFIGPYIDSPLTTFQILEIAESNGISPKNQRYLNEYYNSIPILSENSHLFTMLDTFCERIWNSPSFAIVDRNKEWQIPASPINESSTTDSFDDIMMNMVAVEKRYSYENELIQAVTLGQIHKEKQLLSVFSEQSFERRVSDPLRNFKNYGIIMNTLLRKAAENGGVHPMYLDRVSSKYALKIEQLSAISDSTTLMHEMFISYCRLVRKHSLKDYSPIVQKTIILIDSDLSANLSLSILATNQNVSSGYLSTIFKKETGKTLSEYIREKRIKHAVHLLSTTHLQIQTIALHCGIMDVQYFSKIFKKETGKTPKEYRESIKQI